MSDYTKYLRLMKPAGNEYYNIENFNHNAELIDRETEKLNSAVTEIKEGATREKAGIVQFGTEEGKALEGMMLARLAGAYGYGGDIQDVGVKNPNYIYYDRNTRKMYKCLKQNSDVAAGVENFIPIDNNSLLNRLENLLKIKEYTVRNFLLSDKGNLKNYYYGSLPLDIPYSKVLFIQVIDHGESVLETARISESNNLFVEAVSWIDNPKNLAIKVKVIYTE